jgi:hypothetical protein
VHYLTYLTNECRCGIIGVPYDGNALSMNDSRHGGKRVGAGRPSGVSSALQDAGIVTRKLKGGAEVGWEVLAEEYLSLMRRAVQIAQGEIDGVTVSQGVSMLKTLLELMPKVVGADTGPNDSPITQMLRDMRAQITITPTNN